MWFIESHLSHMTGVHGHSFIFISEFKVSVHIKTRWVIDRARGKTNQFMTETRGDSARFALRVSAGRVTLVMLRGVMSDSWCDSQTVALVSAAHLGTIYKCSSQQ